MQRILVVVQVEHPVLARGEVVNGYVFIGAERVIAQPAQGEHALQRALAEHGGPFRGGIGREEEVKLRLGMRGDEGQNVRFQVGLRGGHVPVGGLNLPGWGELRVVQRDKAVVVAPGPAVHAVAQGIVLPLPPGAQAARQEGAEHGTIEPVRRIVQRIAVVQVHRHVAAGLVKRCDHGVHVQAVDDAPHVVRLKREIKQQRVVVRGAGGGAQLDEAAAEHRVHLRRAEVLRDRGADDGAVVIVAAHDARVGIHLRGVVNRRKIARREAIDLERVDHDDQRAEKGNGARQRRKAQAGPGFSLHSHQKLKYRKTLTLERDSVT